MTTHQLIILFITVIEIINLGGIKQLKKVILPSNKRAILQKLQSANQAKNHQYLVDTNTDYRPMHHQAPVKPCKISNLKVEFIVFLVSPICAEYSLLCVELNWTISKNNKL